MLCSFLVVLSSTGGVLRNFLVVLPGADGMLLRFSLMHLSLLSMLLRLGLVQLSLLGMLPRRAGRFGRAMNGLSSAGGVQHSFQVELSSAGGV